MKKNTAFLFFLFIFLLCPIAVTAQYSDKESNFLVISDIHLDQASTHVMDISPLKADRNNDLDYPSFEKLILDVENNIKNGVVAQPKFILILGDIAGHMRYSQQSASENEAIVFRVLKDTFPDIPIFYTFGNNDSPKTNYGPFTDSSRGEYNSPYEIAKYAGGWSDGFLSVGTMCAVSKAEHYPCIITENTISGYYSAYIESHLQLISINSVLFSPSRKTTKQEAAEQLQWLDKQLERAKNNHEKALIIMHIPPGNNIQDHSGFWLGEEQTAFLKTVNQYQQTVIGLLASHTHAEELKIIKDRSQNNIAGVYLVAGLSTSHGNEPSVKTFYLSQENEQWQLSNYEAFHFSAEGSNLIFSKLYDYNSYYCNGEVNKLLQCLNNVTPERMDKYLAAGNRNYTGGVIRSPKDIILAAAE
ncbi:metallophosphoesterase [Legionella cardiaca]|uniref:Metallophosphoesterase n=1 Tax=Legionella cardiaca TaxID=1071983 RepID=A0ABY8AYN1_9GAMM|nr:metallophosphoesterase [Legionella cardiaca]WED44247.1 metallophosphoesterase [Legionella cardiaca]